MHPFLPVVVNNLTVPGEKQLSLYKKDFVIPPFPRTSCATASCIGIALYEQGIFHELAGNAALASEPFLGNPEYRVDDGPSGRELKSTTNGQFAIT